MNWSSYVFQRTYTSGWLESTLNERHDALAAVKSGESSGFEWKSRVKLGGIAIAATVEAVVYAVLDLLMTTFKYATCFLHNTKVYEKIKAKASDISDKKYAPAMVLCNGLVGVIKPEWAANNAKAGLKALDEQVGESTKGCADLAKFDKHGKYRQAQLARFDKLAEIKIKALKGYLEGKDAAKELSEEQLKGQFDRFKDALAVFGDNKVEEYHQPDTQTLDKFAAAKAIRSAVDNCALRGFQTFFINLKQFDKQFYDAWHYKLVAGNYAKNEIVIKKQALKDTLQTLRGKIDKSKDKELAQFDENAKKLEGEFDKTLKDLHLQLFGQNVHELFKMNETDKDGTVINGADGNPTKCDIEGQFEKFIQMCRKLTGSRIAFAENNFEEVKASSGPSPVVLASTEPAVFNLNPDVEDVEGKEEKKGNVDDTSNVKPSMLPHDKNKQHFLVGFARGLVNWARS